MMALLFSLTFSTKSSKGCFKNWPRLDRSKGGAFKNPKFIFSSPLSLRYN
ncbi:Hypothetical protein Minf_0108 [Methylacidiphilum infernorum V4]|uniref:Uncharacterized protein n=1 Tax=Methylacidiphilum infernorum (isolate V4) TaxID=481448 RepID=B3DX28_METI4|nr:Hypothetical protein Minf_0108 [Methylacidiphilum infernorum V4]